MYPSNGKGYDWERRRTAPKQQQQRKLEIPRGSLMVRIQNNLYETGPSQPSDHSPPTAPSPPNFEPFQRTTDRASSSSDNTPFTQPRESPTPAVMPAASGPVPESPTSAASLHSQNAFTRAALRGRVNDRNGRGVSLDSPNLECAGVSPHPSPPPLVPKASPVQPAGLQGYQELEDAQGDGGEPYRRRRSSRQWKPVVSPPSNQPPKPQQPPPSSPPPASTATSLFPTSSSLEGGDEHPAPSEVPTSSGAVIPESTSRATRRNQPAAMVPFTRTISRDSGLNVVSDEAPPTSPVQIELFVQPQVSNYEAHSSAENLPRNPNPPQTPTESFHSYGRKEGEDMTIVEELVRETAPATYEAPVPIASTTFSPPALTNPIPFKTPDKSSPASGGGPRPLSGTKFTPPNVMPPYQPPELRGGVAKTTPTQAKASPSQPSMPAPQFDSDIAQPHEQPSQQEPSQGSEVLRQFDYGDNYPNADQNLHSQSDATFASSAMMHTPYSVPPNPMATAVPPNQNLPPMNPYPHPQMMMGCAPGPSYFPPYPSPGLPAPFFYGPPRYGGPYPPMGYPPPMPYWAPPPSPFPPSASEGVPPTTDDSPNGEALDGGASGETEESQQSPPVHTSSTRSHSDAYLPTPAYSHQQHPYPPQHPYMGHPQAYPQPMMMPFIDPGRSAMPSPANWTQPPSSQFPPPMADNFMVPQPNYSQPNMM